MRFKFTYKNHEGKTEERDVDVVSLSFSFANNPDYGYQPGWCISGWDYSRGRTGTDYRSFFLHNIIIPDGIEGSKRLSFHLLNFPREQ